MHPFASRPARGPLLRLAWLLVLWTAGLLWPLAAAADLMLFPTRVVFERNQRAAQVELINNSPRTVTYRISLVNRRMTETGQFVPAEPPQPGEQFAANMLRFSPRQVVLAPGGGQTVRLLLRKPAELADGEYRSHLQFSQVPEAAGASDLEARRDLGSSEIGVQLQAVVSVSIPVIVRHGETSAEVQLQQLQLQAASGADAPMISATLLRSGNRSVYGDLVATHVDASGQEREVARAGGVAVYTPNSQRRLRLALSPQAGTLRGGSLRLVYRERAEAGGKTLAEATVPLP